jgi:3-hydroxybutyryl-CoA dehydrogenase
MPRPIASVLIVGAGWNGRQVAAQCVAHGIRTYLTDNREEATEASLRWILEHVSTMVAEKKWPPTALEGIDERLFSVQVGELGSLGVDLAIECVHEQISSKRRVLRDLSETLSETTLIASNSSYFTPSMLSKFVMHPERFGHFHFHSPVWNATIVDIVPGPQASADVAERLRALAIQIGQTPIVQTVENPGYIFNWILQAMLKSSLELVERKVATPEDIEMSWKTVTGMQLGPFGMMDLIGIDLIHQVLSNARWMGDYEETQKLIDILQPWLDRGELGVKSGQGFFDYNDQRNKADVGTNH